MVSATSERGTHALNRGLNMHRFNPKLSKLPNAFYMNDVLESYSSKKATLVTMAQLRYFGKRLSTDKLIKYAKYLQTELPIRYF
jgi:hypothetical protein